MADLMRAITGIKTELTAEIAGVSRNVVNMEQTMGTVLGSVKTLTSDVEQQKKNMTNLQEKFSKMEADLRKTREEVAGLKNQVPQAFSSVVARSNRGQEVLTGANLQEQGAGSRARVVGGRMEQERRDGMANDVREGRQEIIHGREVGEHWEEEQIKTICEKSRRTIGFKQIGENDIKRMYGEAVPYGGASTRDEALILTVKEFMHYELKIAAFDQENMEIEEIFERKSEQLDTVYVRFKYRSSMSKIFERVRFLRKDSQLVTYIPREFQERFKALNEKVKIMRQEGDGWRTRVKLGQMDFVISKKEKQIGAVYQTVTVDMRDMPQVCLARPQTAVTNSPPPGRPGHREGAEVEGRKRRRSGNASGATPTTKAVRKEDEESQSEDYESEKSQDDSGEEDEGETVSKVTSRRKKPAAYCGPPTIDPICGGLLTKPSLGEVSEVQSVVNGKVSKSVKSKEIAQVTA